jgi:ribosomal 50S subunit-recycling heat shock protein
MCDGGAASVDGKKAKAGKDIEIGRTIALNLRNERIELEVTALPDRNYKRKAGEAFYDILRHESKDPLS